MIARLARASGLQVTLMAVAGTLPAAGDAAGPCAVVAVRRQRDRGIAAPAGGRGDRGCAAGHRSVVRAASPYDALISAINAHPAPVLSIDLPSGLNADTGAAAGAVVRADHTQSFICLKPGLLTGLARAVVGQLHCDPLGLTVWLAQQDWPLLRLDGHCLPRWLVPRSPLAHKGDNGRLLLIGGDSGMGGAIRLAGQAALRSGAGLVRVLTRAEHVAPLLAAAPELMVKALGPDTLREALSWAEAVVVGPGLGQGEWGQMALAALASVRKPMLWDADALNLLSGAPSACEWRVMTPHPGEAARLLGCDIADVESDRPAAVRALQRRYGGVAILKGAGTLIADNARCAIADIGNPGMASGGMGDILSGIIGGLLAQSSRCMMQPAPAPCYTAWRPTPLRDATASGVCWPVTCCLRSGVGLTLEFELPERTTQL
ncbi:NAD(P)H-hydrate dehydratase [Edwardsiella anguillarum]|nr:NAD(P)H-hydrate dehydratase [Edwardsiella anguillarum]